MWIIVWIALCMAVGVFADRRGRSGGGWFLLSLVISPLLGLIFVGVSQDLAKERQAKAAELGPRTHVKCPSCAEWVLPEAMVCKHCGGALAPDADFHIRRAQQATAVKREDSNNLAIGVAAIFGLFLLAGIISRCSG